MIYILLQILKLNKSMQNKQQLHLYQTIKLIEKVLELDQHILEILPLYQNSEIVFQKFMQQKHSAKRQIQKQQILKIAGCFYRIDENQISRYQKQYEKFMSKRHYIPRIVNILEQYRKLLQNFKKDHNFLTLRQKITQIDITPQENQKEQFYNILEWKQNSITLLIDSLLSKKPIQKQPIIKLIKLYKSLRYQDTINIFTATHVFSEMALNLISSKNNNFMYLQGQIQKNIRLDELNNEGRFKFIQTIQRCREFSQKLFFFNNQSKNPHLPIKKKIIPQKRTTRQKLKLNLLFNPHLDTTIQVKQHHSVTQSKRIILKRKKSQQNRNSISSNSLHVPQNQDFSCSFFNFRKENHSKQQIKQPMTQTNFFFKRSLGKRKRLDIYKSIEGIGNKDQKFITQISLKDEITLFPTLQIQQCKITFEQILFNTKLESNHEQEIKNYKFQGSLIDKEFKFIILSFKKIFNQQIANISITITNKNRELFIRGQVSSNFTSSKAPIMFDSVNQQQTRQVEFKQLEKLIQKSPIYYEVIQQKIEKKNRINEIQMMQKFIKKQYGLNMSQKQISNIVQCIQIIEEEFFWYYTKINTINGSFLSKRVMKSEEIFQNLSAFAVSLAKFKSDYNNCMNQIIMVQNSNSLIETCNYLCYGRLIIYRQFVIKKNNIFLKIIKIPEQVYKSFDRKNRIPYFRKLILHEQLYCLNGQKKQTKTLKLNDLMSENQCLILFMKNIVENFIEIKYMRRLMKYISQKEVNQGKKSYFDEVNFDSDNNYHVEIRQSEFANESYNGYKSKINKKFTIFSEIISQFCRTYYIHPSFKIVKKQKFVINIKNNFYLCKAFFFINKIIMLFVTKNIKKLSYFLFLFDEDIRSKQFTFIQDVFYNKVAILSNDLYLVINATKNKQIQDKYIRGTNLIVKKLARQQDLYFYVAIFDCITLKCWKIKIYHPQRQATFLTYLSYCETNELLESQSKKKYWNDIIKSMKVNFAEQLLTIGLKRFRIAKCFCKMVKSQLLLNIFVVNVSFKKLYLIQNHEMNSLYLSQIQDYNYTDNLNIFSEIVCKQTQISLYKKLLSKFIKQINSNKKFTAINTTYFLYN